MVVLENKGKRALYKPLRITPAGSNRGRQRHGGKNMESAMVCCYVALRCAAVQVRMRYVVSRLFTPARLLSLVEMR